jgi:hypothetical protein
MWSYYALGHNGYALAFDTKMLPFAQLCRFATGANIREFRCRSAT